MSIVVLNPVQEAVVTGHGLAPRLGTLTGKTVGLYNNEKLNAANLLELVRAELEKNWSFKIVHGVYNPGRIMAPEEWGPDIGACDVVILANGDCGACSTSGISNAIELEKRGIPTLLISTKPFFEAVRISAQLRGMPQIRWAVVDHPIGSLGEDELKKRAAVAVGQIADLILERETKRTAA
jgi:hypothetical protein